MIFLQNQKIIFPLQSNDWNRRRWFHNKQSRKKQDSQ